MTLAPALIAEGSGGRGAPSSCSLESWRWHMETLTPSVASRPSNRLLPARSPSTFQAAAPSLCTEPWRPNTSACSPPPFGLIRIQNQVRFNIPSQGSLPAHSQVRPELPQPPRFSFEALSHCHQ